MVKRVQRELALKSLEEKIQEFWRNSKIYEESKARLAKKPKYYFLDGPPYASGAIHLGTAWNKILKDSIARYLAAQGLNVRRQAGWDCHGLPIEVKVEEKLGIENKKEIEELGIEKFVKECKGWAHEHIGIMTSQFQRLGVWLDWDKPYTTMSDEYIEAAWWTIKRAHEKGLLAKDMRVVTWCPRCETALAEAEIEYEDREDPSIYVKFPVVDKEDEFLLIWTTTPWTLIANLAVMVHPDFEYVRAKTKEGILILAKELAPLLKDKFGLEYETLSTHTGSELEGMRYVNPLSALRDAPKAYFVILTPHYVSLEEGTGCVHCAPGHGPEDFEVGAEYGIPPICPVDERGAFTEQAERYAGKIVKKDDELIIKDLKERGVLLGSGTIVHRYGHCWRCKTPIIYRATEQWFILVTKLKEKMLGEIGRVEWVPEWAGSARFMDWVANARDWTISRQRYWGIPLPIWICAECGRKEVIGSKAELERRSGMKVKELHRPYTDEARIPCECGGKKNRVPDVLDVWFDSGVASWASIGYPRAEAEFKKWYPVDFITEGHDQTRGWFYSMLGCGLLAFDEVPYRRVLMHGFTLDEKGEKMSKSLGNVVEPEEIIEKYGADVLRFYVLWSNKPWEDLRFNWGEVDVVHKMFNVLWNVYVFATTYMSIDGFAPEKVAKATYRVEDKWVLSRLNSLIAEITDAFESFQIHRAARAVKDFVLEDLSRWYIVLVRPRTWVEKDDPEKLGAYAALYEVLLKLSRIMAPIAPHLCEEMYSNLDGAQKSVHLEPWPKPSKKSIDERLERDMSIARAISDAVASARGKMAVKRRWPLARVIYSPGSADSLAAAKRLEELIKAQSNALRLEFLKPGEEFGEFRYRPNMSTVGPDFKEKAGAVAEYISSLDATSAKKLRKGLTAEIGGARLKLLEKHVVAQKVLPENFATEAFEHGRVYLNLERTPEVLSLGYAREVVRRIQEMRKEMDLDIEAYVESRVGIDAKEIAKFLEDQRGYIASETRSKSLVISSKIDGRGHIKEWLIEENKFIISVVQI